MQTLTAHLPILMVVVPLLIAIWIPVVGMARKNLAFPLVLGAMSLALAIAVGLIVRVIAGGTIDYHVGGWAPPWGIALRVDFLSAFMVLVVTVIAFLVTIYTKRSIEKEHPGKETHFYTVFLLLFVGLIGMLVTGDMFNLYVFLEVSSLTAYALIAMASPRAAVSAFRYVVVGTIGACFYLLGVGYLFIMTGTLNMADLAVRLPELYESRVIIIAAIFFVLGMGIKMGLFPLHTWLPDSYTNAPSAVSIYIAPLMSKVAAYTTIRVLFTVFEPRFSAEVVPIQDLLSYMAGAAILYGSYIAIKQSDFKRMLAYSSIAQIGYIVLGFSLGNQTGFIGSILHILNHAFMKGCLFAAAGAIVYTQGHRTIEKFGFLHKKMPLTSIALAIAAISMIGLPPTAGFFSKWYLLLGSIEAGSYGFVGVILLSSLLNAVYFFRVIEFVFWKPARELGAQGELGATAVRAEAPKSMLAPMLVMAAALLVIGLASNWLVETLIGPAVPAGIL